MIERVYGDIYEDEARLGVYSADLGTETHDELVLVSIGTQCWDDYAAKWERCNVTVEVRATASEYQMAFAEAEASPYEDTSILGRVLGRAEALASSQRDWFLHVLDHIVLEDPHVRAHFSAAADRSSPDEMA